MIPGCNGAASSFKAQITTSCPWKASTSWACEVRSALLMSTFGGKVAVEEGRLRAETVNMPWDRRAAVIGAPIVPLAFGSFNELSLLCMRRGREVEGRNLHQPRWCFWMPGLPLRTSLLESCELFWFCTERVSLECFPSVSYWHQVRGVKQPSYTLC